MSYIYLASPYSHPSPEVMHARFLAAEALTAWLLRHSKWVYSPIVHCHSIAQNYQLPTDFHFWADYNLEMLRHAGTVWILEIPGLRDSKGVQAEIEYARVLRIPTHLVNWKLHPAFNSSLSGKTLEMLDTAMGEKGAKAL